MFFAASHVEGLPVLYPPAAWPRSAAPWPWRRRCFRTRRRGDGFLPWLTGAGSAAAVLYAVRLIRSGPLQAEPVRRWSLAGAALLGLCSWPWSESGTMQPPGRRQPCWPPPSGCLHEAPERARRIALEIGALVLTAAVQRAAIFALDGPDRLSGRLFAGLPDPFWVAHGTWSWPRPRWLALPLRPSGRRAVLVGVAAGLLSFSGLGVVFGGTGTQDLWVLVLLAVLLVTGLVVGDRLFAGGERPEWPPAFCGR